MGRMFVIGAAVMALLVRAGRARFSSATRASLPEYFRTTLEHLGTPFVKLGQVLSIRRDLLPDDIIAALQGLQDSVGAFPSGEARAAIEQALGRSIEQVFGTFEAEPFAAASIAQVHRARLLDGREVVVKVRRPGIRIRIDRDMRLLILVLRALAKILPALDRYQAVSLAREIWNRLQVETDLRREADNVRRFVQGFRGQPLVYVPDVEDSLCTEGVMVQALSHGLRIDDTRFRDNGPRLARALVDIYLHQFFVMGVFHGDPHPGNVFVLEDGRLCFHDFGIVGQLTVSMRRHLAMFVLALAHQDEEWLLDATIDLGVLSGNVDRRQAREGIGTILAECAGQPVGAWSLGQMLVRVMRLNHGEGLMFPVNLSILARTALLLEDLLGQLDAKLTVVDAVAKADPELMRSLFVAPETPALIRLESEAVTAAHELPTLAAQWLHRTLRGDGGIPVSFRVETLESTSRGFVRSTDRLALALVTLGLYVAASLLMQHSIGPTIFGDLPAFAAMGYALALWFTWRITRGIANSEKGVGARGMQRDR